MAATNLFGGKVIPVPALGSSSSKPIRIGRFGGRGLGEPCEGKLFGSAGSVSVVGTAFENIARRLKAEVVTLDYTSPKFKDKVRRAEEGFSISVYTRAIPTHVDRILTYAYQEGSTRR